MGHTGVRRDVTVPRGPPGRDGMGHTGDCRDGTGWDGTHDKPIGWGGSLGYKFQLPVNLLFLFVRS